MRIGIIGTGYVGLVTSVCFAHSGHNVIGLDKNTETVYSLNQGKATIYEDSLEDMLNKALANNMLSFTSNHKDLADCTVIFFAVGTPPLPNGHADLSQIFSAIDNLLPYLTNDTLLVIRSTVPVGTSKKIHAYLAQKNIPHQPLGFCPEFLREGVAVHDFLHPSYIVLASDTPQNIALMKKVYNSIIANHSDEVTIIECDIFETAELIKYTINSFLAVKITFMNQIAQLAQKTNANIEQVIHAIGSDKRISNQFLNPGPGFGGSCFPKDTIALVKSGLDYGVELSVVEEAHHSNQKHKEFIASWIMETLKKEYDLIDSTIAVWGLTFKANTDDVRDSASISIIDSLIQYGVTVVAHDPQGSQHFNNMLSHARLSTVESELEALDGAGALVILTEWDQYATISPKAIVDRLSGNIVFDTRGVVYTKDYEQHGLVVHRFGISPSHTT